MQKIAKHEVHRVAVKGAGGPGAGMRERIYQEVAALEVGEAVTITKKEWGVKSPPYWMINRVARNRDWKAKYKVRTFVDETGWLITRIK